MNALELKAIHKSFGKTQIIRGIDLEVQDGEFLVFHFHHIDVQNRMVGFGVQCDSTSWALDADARLNGCQHFFAVQGTGFFDTSRPQHDALVLRHGNFMHQLGVAKTLGPLGQKVFVGRVGIFLAVVTSDQNAIAFSSRQRQMLVADTEGG